MTSAVDRIYRVEVTNWPEPSGQTITTALAAASLMVAVVALITSIASLRWMKESWRREGATLEVEFYFYKLAEDIQMYLGDPTFKVRVRNSGRTMTEINWVCIWAIKDGQSELVAVRSGEAVFGEDRRLQGGQQCSVDIGFPDLIPEIGLQNLVGANSVQINVDHTFGNESRVLPLESMEGLRGHMEKVNINDKPKNGERWHFP